MSVTFKFIYLLQCGMGVKPVQWLTHIYIRTFFNLEGLYNLCNIVYLYKFVSVSAQRIVLLFHWQIIIVCRWSGHITLSVNTLYISTFQRYIISVLILCIVITDVSKSNMCKTCKNCEKSFVFTCDKTLTLSPHYRIYLVWSLLLSVKTLPSKNIIWDI